MHAQPTDAPSVQTRMRPEPASHRGRGPAGADIAAQAAQLLTAHTQQEVFIALSHAIRASLGTAAANANVTEPAQGAAVLPSIDGVQTPDFSTPTWPPGTGLGGAVAHAGQPPTTTDYIHDPALSHSSHLDRQVREEGLLSNPVVRLRAYGQLLRAVLGGNRDTLPYSPKDTALLQALHDVAGAALHRQSCLRSAEQRAQAAEARARELLREWDRPHVRRRWRPEDIAEQRAALVAALASGRLSEPDYGAAATSVGLPSLGAFHVAVLIPQQQPVHQLRPRWLLEVCHLGGMAATLPVATTSSLLVLLPAKRWPTPAAAVAALAGPVGPETMDAIGTAGPVAGAEALTRAICAARRTAQLLLNLGAREGLACADDIGPLAVFAAGAEPGELTEAIDEALRPFQQVSNGRRDQLLATLAAWLDRDASATRVARALGIHVNTVYARLTQIDELLGPGWRQGRRRLELDTALRLHFLRRNITVRVP